MYPILVYYVIVWERRSISNPCEVWVRHTGTWTIHPIPSTHKRTHSIFPWPDSIRLFSISQLEVESERLPIWHEH